MAYGDKNRVPARPSDHKLGDRQQHLFNMLLSGHTHWHSVVDAARKGYKAQLLRSLYLQKQIIENAISQIERLE